MRALLLIIALLLSSLNPSHTEAFNDHVRTTEALIHSQTATLSGTVNIPFTLYIGDDITELTDPVKNVYFTLSGLYTGSGSFTVGLDSNVPSQRTYTLPSVVVPTPFEVLYQDVQQIISPTSPGTYAYTLNVIPSGLTVTGFGVRVTETHRYKVDECYDGSTQKIRTSEALIANQLGATTSLLSTPFTIYIGDDLKTVPNALKSVYFTATGLYTGAGTLTFNLDGNGGSQRVYTLPTVSAPTPFEVLYKDPTTVINPTSSGTYAYTLNMTPSGLTLTGLSIRVTETHRYIPPECGSGFPISGELTSAVFDTTGQADGPIYHSIMWKGVLGGAGADEGKVRFQLATSDCANGATNAPTCTTGTWTFLGGDACSTLDYFDAPTAGTPVEIKNPSCQSTFNNKRYFKYKVQICSADCSVEGVSSPRVDDVVVSWAP